MFVFILINKVSLVFILYRSLFVKILKISKCLLGLFVFTSFITHGAGTAVFVGPDLVIYDVWGSLRADRRVPRF